MKVATLGCLGLILGEIVGGAIGVGLGFAWTASFNTTSFEGYSGMLIFFTFLPIGAIVGGMLGGVGLGLVAARDDADASPKS